MWNNRGFLKAAERGDTEAIQKYLLDKGERWTALRDSDGASPLHLAAQGSHVDAVQMLVDAGFDVNATNKKGLTPLAAAAISNAPNAMKVLIDNGANVNIDLPGWTSLINLTVGNHNAHVTKMLLEAGADPDKGNPLLRAFENRSHELAEALLKAGADPNVEGQSKYRPIHYAAQNGAEGIMKMLLEKGVDINQQEYRGNTPLHVAIAHGQAKIVEMLLEKGARIDIVNTYGHDAYHDAKDSRNPQILRLVEPLAKAEQAKKMTPLTATAEAMPAQDAEAWLRMGDRQVARVAVYPPMGRRITEIFNFEARERLIISENLKNGAENVTPPQSFDHVAEATLTKALAAFRDLGGQVNDDEVFSHPAKKATLKP
jgi:ankyrin repeat protein